jgi:hypothetical protein
MAALIACWLRVVNFDASMAVFDPFVCVRWVLLAARSQTDRAAGSAGQRRKS